MIHNHQQKTRFRSLTDDLCCIVVKEIKILFNLVIFEKKKKRIYISELSNLFFFISEFMLRKKIIADSTKILGWLVLPGYHISNKASTR